MENRERDRVSQRHSGTEAGEQNRRTEESRSHSPEEFGGNIGEAERARDLGNDTGGTVDTSEGRH